MITKYQVDCARERIRNYIDDRPELDQERFAFAIGRSKNNLSKFLSEKPHALGDPALRKCAEVMGITYAKLISKFGPEDCEVQA